MALTTLVEPLSRVIRRLRRLALKVGLARRHLGPPQERLVDSLRVLPQERHHEVLTDQLSPTATWHSWDATPWAHPWLKSENLAKAKSFEERLMRQVIETYGGALARTRRYAFAGNLANNMAMRALPLRRCGYSIDLFLHPQDRSVMSQPGWELSEAELPSGVTNIDQMNSHGISLPAVEGVFTPPQLPQEDLGKLISLSVATPAALWTQTDTPNFVRQRDVLIWPSYFAFLPFLEALQPYDSVFVAQAPYLAHLAGKPYLAAQTGGDLWLEASRNDLFGVLQRRSYAKAAAILATNPWAYSNARRFGFHHVIYLPLMIDTELYAPGPSPARQAWQREVGGEFFALVTARIDRRWKGSHIGIEGFVQFAARNPQARLVLVGWGESCADDIEELKKNGLEGRFVQLPISGKRKLIEYLRGADCLIDQFMIGYYGATALEAMSAGVPVIMHLLSEQYEALCPTGAPPVLNASTPQQVAGCLERLVRSKDERASISVRSRRWIEANHSTAAWGEHYGALLNAIASGALLDFAGSPLNDPLTLEERDYHAAGLAAAPTFPNYVI